MHRMNYCHYNEGGRTPPQANTTKRDHFYVRHAFMIRLNRLFNGTEVECIKEKLKVADF